MSFDPDKYLAGAPPAKSFDPDEYLKGPSLVKDVGHSFALGALDQGAGSMLQGAADFAEQGAPKLVEGVPGTDLAGVEENLRRLKTRRRELMGEPSEYRTSANDEAPQFAPADDKVIADLDADIDRHQKRYNELTAKVAAPGKAASEKVGEFRQAVRDVYPVSDKFKGGLPGQVISGLGQAVGAAPAFMTGVGLPAAASQVFDQQFQDALEKTGGDREKAFQAGVMALPGALPEYVSDSFALHGVGKAIERLAKGGGVTVAKLAADTTMAALLGGTTEAGQQIYSNLVAKKFAGYDPDRDITEGALMSFAVGALVDGFVRGGTGAAEIGLHKMDTGRTKPESPATLKLQQDQLTKGERVAQMFPTGTPELDLPKGMDRVETERGIFHFNPGQVSAADIEALSGQGRENLVLGLGKFSKDEVMKRHADGEPLATVTERAPDGTEARAAVVVPSTLAETTADMEAGKSPGHTVQPENLVDTLRKREVTNATATADTAAAEEKARTERFNDKQGRRERFDNTLKVARETYQRGAGASFAEVEGALNAVRFYAEDNSVGLLPEQKAAAVKATQLLEQIHAKMQPDEVARRDAEKQQRADVGAEQQQQQRARIAAEKKNLASQADLDPTTGRKRLDAMTEDELATAAQGGDKAAERMLEQRSSGEQGGDSLPLKTVLERVRLPATDETLGAELKQLQEETRSKGLFKGKQPLDRLAQTLRTEYGFSQIKTPADVISFAQRALRGERIMPDWAENARPEFSRGKQSGLTDSEVDSRWQSMRAAFPELEREWLFVRGEVHDVLEKAGYTGEVPDDVQASVLPPELLAQWQRKRAERGMIVFAERMLNQPGKAPKLMLHELGHRYWDSLPVETQEALRDLNRQEVENRTGPLFDAKGEPATDIRFLPEDFTPEELHADPDLPLREWFAERLAQVNAGWANGRISSRDTLLSRVAFDLREILQRIQRWVAKAQGRRVESALLEREFRRFLRQGAKQLDAAGRAEAVNYARDGRPEFARKRANPRDAKTVQGELDQVQQQLDGLKESNEEPADIEARGAELTKKQTALQKELVRAKRDDQVAASIKTPRDIDDRVDPMSGAVIVPSIKPVDRKAALKSELERGKKLLADGATEGNTAAKTEGERLVRLATERLNDEYAGWDQPEAPAPDRKADLMARLKEAERNVQREVVGAESWADKYREQLNKEFPGWEEKPAARTYEEPHATEEPAAHPADLESDPFAPTTEPVDAAATAAKHAELEGQGLEEPSAVQQTWEKMKGAIQSFRGSLPEVPTFPWTKLAQKGDTFLQGNPTFYNRLKLGLRLLRSSNDYVYKTAEDRVAGVVRPLLAAGRGNFDGDAYAQLRKRQTQLRKIREEGETVPPGVAAEVRALQSRLADNPLMLFQRAVLYLDMDWRARHLKDDEGNPIRLPMGLTAGETSAKLDEISKQIGASPHRQVIEQALQKHMDLVKQTAEDLKERGLLAAEHLQNPYYFPHIIAEKTAGNLAKVSVDTSADFRGYLITPVGSAKAIETDYVRAMYYHLVQVFAHNQRADIVRDYFQRYDITPKVKEAAERLSKRYGRPVSVNEAFHTEFADKGYQLYGAGEGDVFPAVQIDRDRLAVRLGVPITGEEITKQLAKLGMDGIKLLPGDLKDVVNSGARETWVLPEHVAEALRGMIRREGHQAGAVESALAGIQGLWKKHILYAPWNYIRYEYGNTLADLEKLFSADPAVYSQLSSSAKEIREFFAGGTASEDLQQAMKLGVLQSITAHELNALPQLRAFEEMQTTKQKWGKQAKARLSSLLVQPISAPAGMGDRTTTQLSQFREAMFRFAKFKADMDRMRAGASPAYAGAYWKDVEAIEDSKPGAGDANYLKAALISRSTFGDYGDLSVAGDTLRKLLIPFYSWTEVNFKYHANLFRNYRDAVTAGEISRAEALKAGGRAGAALAAGLTRRAASGFLFRLALPYAAVALWNSIHHADIEDELSDEDRRRFHLNVGRTKDGRPLVVYMPTAFSDVIKWFSGPEFARLATDYVRGRTDLGTAFGQWRDHLVPDFLNNTLGSIGPLYKAPYTLLSKKSAFPDVTDQRTVPSYDMARVIIGQMTDQFTADMIMRVTNKDYYGSRDMKDWARQLILQARVRDPQQWAFYDLKDKAADFLEQKTGKKRDMDYDAPDQQVLRNFRKAIYSGDAEGATRFYLRLLQFGYTAERFKQSIQSQDPLAGLPKDLRDDFVRSLSDWDRKQTLTRAFEYYTRMADAKGQEPMLFPREKWGEKGRAYFEAKPQVNRLQKIIDMQIDLPEDVLSHQAMMELRRSLAPTAHKPSPPRPHISR